MSAWWEGAKTAMDWLDDNEWAGSLIGDLIKDGLSKDPKMDYDKILEMAIKDAVINSPDQNTPTMSSRWVVDPKTGKRVQTIEYTEAIKPLFDMLVNHAGAPTNTYHAPDSFDAMLGGYINDREQHMGLPKSQYEPFDAGEWWSPGGGGSSGVPGGGSTPPPTGPNGTGPRMGGSGINPNEGTSPGGGTGGLGRPGGPPAGATDPMRDQQGLIRDLIAHGFVPEGGSGSNNFSPKDWDKAKQWLLENTERFLGNKWFQRAVSLLGAPNVATGMQIAGKLATHALNKRAGAGLSDFENQEWGSWDSPPPGSEGGGSYWDKLLGQGAGAARDPNFSGKGMPGASMTPDDTMDWYSQGPRGTPGGGPGNTVGGQGMGAGSSMGSLGSLAASKRDRLINQLIRSGLTPEQAAQEADYRSGRMSPGQRDAYEGNSHDRGPLEIDIWNGNPSGGSSGNTGTVGVSDLPYGWRSANSSNPTWKP